MYPRIISQWKTVDKLRHTRRIVQIAEGEIQYEYMEYDSMGGEKWTKDGGVSKSADNVLVYTILQLYDEMQKLKIPTPPAKDPL